MLQRIVWTTSLVVLAIACVDGGDLAGPALPTASDQPLFSSLSSGAWESVASLTNARDLLGAAAGPNGRLYAIGGSSGTTTPVSIASVEVYDPESNSWVAGPSLPSARHALAAATDAAGTLYAIGGIQGGSVTASVVSLAPGASSWSPVAPLTNPRQAHAAAVGADGRIYVTGGVNGSGQVLNTAEVYDPSANRWTSVAQMPRIRRLHALALGPDGRLYAIGGFSTSSALTTVVDVYNPSTNAWTTVAPLPQGRQGLSAALGTDNRIYVVGGKDAFGSPLGVTYVYDLRTNTWSAGPTLINARAANAAAVLGDRLYAVAGRERISGTERPWTSVEALLADVPNAAPAVNAGPDVTISEGGTFAVTGSYTDGDSYQWTATVDYGDNSGTGSLTLSAGSFALAHTYADNGAYTVTVRVTDDKGAVGTDVVLVTVNNVAPAVRAWPQALLVVGETFMGGGDFADPGADTWTATVDYGDGSGAVPLSLEEGGFSLEHVYLTSGDFSLTVAVTDDDGGTGTAVITVRVVTPAGAVGVLMDDLRDLTGLLRARHGNMNPLLAPLRGAQALLERGDLNGARGMLGAFINQVEARMRTGRIPQAQGQELIDLANRAIAAIG